MADSSDSVNLADRLRAAAANMTLNPDLGADMLAAADLLAPKCPDCNGAWAYEVVIRHMTAAERAAYTDVGHDHFVTFTSLAVPDGR